ncbi:hypothetical protein Z959_09880 [Clostridium novyi B str. ATCC 27606]|uniref:Uncharacterized protein n=1 Tax=Clostridium novyi B str. ATCC 27606 TaxID=1443123 RepID=A0AA40IUB2_CLONO|nr:hypothetical protein [Clostridium novyi]KEI12537.1 hypothetical protein Z958_06390 [Clostridium novyi B str. NCTC 9691]KEI16394.1 hypothetical protein Z959_09880 [Clostridium novyi B str. ATCC 27606]
MTILMFSIAFFIFKDSFYYSTIKKENQYFDIQSTIKEEIKIDFNILFMHIKDKRGYYSVKQWVFTDYDVVNLAYEDNTLIFDIKALGIRNDTVDSNIKVLEDLRIEFIIDLKQGNQGILVMDRQAGVKEILGKKIVDDSKTPISYLYKITSINDKNSLGINTENFFYEAKVSFLLEKIQINC